MFCAEGVPGGTRWGSWREGCSVLAVLGTTSVLSGLRTRRTRGCARLRQHNASRCRGAEEVLKDVCGCSSSSRLGILCSFVARGVSGLICGCVRPLLHRVLGGTPGCVTLCMAGGGMQVLCRDPSHRLNRTRCFAIKEIQAELFGSMESRCLVHQLLFRVSLGHQVCPVCRLLQRVPIWFCCIRISLLYT